VSSILVELLIAAGIPTAAALLAQWRESAVNARRHVENTRRLDLIEQLVSSGPTGSFVTRREFDIHAQSDSDRFELINHQLSEIRQLLVDKEA
jgi:hypothetical protein